MAEYRFKTGRLIIRDMTLEDLDQVAKIWGNIEVGKYLADVAKENIGSLKACYNNGFKNYRQMTFKKAGTDIIYHALELRKMIG